MLGEKRTLYAFCTSVRMKHLDGTKMKMAVSCRDEGLEAVGVGLPLIAYLAYQTALDRKRDSSRESPSNLPRDSRVALAGASTGLAAVEVVLVFGYPYLPLPVAAVPVALSLTLITFFRR